MTVQRLLLRFSYHEHDWDEAIDGAEAMEAELLRRAAEGEWLEFECAEEPESVFAIDDLVQEAEDVVIGEWEMPAAAVRIPVDKLRAIIADGGWTFVAGEFMDFEGHHNDTEMTVKLVRAEA